MVPGSRSSTDRPVSSPRNLFREVPTRTGGPSSTSSCSRPSSSRLCSMVLPKPIPGSMRIRSAAMPLATANSRRRVRYALTSATTSSYRGSICMVRGSPSMCIRQQPARAPPPPPAMSGSPSAVTSLTIVAPAWSAAWATSALEVSTHSRAEVPQSASPWMTGSTRAFSSSAVTGAAPGRVDSPPMSRISAPSASRRRPWATAASGARNRPPSEKESGVTLITPIRVKGGAPILPAATSGSGAPSLIRPPPVTVEVLARLLLPDPVPVALHAHPKHPVDQRHDHSHDEEPHSGCRGGTAGAGVAGHDGHDANHRDGQGDHPADGIKHDAVPGHARDVTPADRAGEGIPPELLSRSAGQTRPGQRARGLAPGTVRGGRGRRYGNLGRRRSLGAEDLLLGLSPQEGLELLLLDRLALDQDLGQLGQRRAVLGQDVLGLDVGRFDDPSDLVVNLASDLVRVIGLGAELAAQKRLAMIVAEDPGAQFLGHPESHHHLLCGLGHLLQVIGGTGGHLIEDDLLGCPTSQRHGHVVQQLRPGGQELVLARQGDRVAQRLTAGDHGDLVDGVGVRQVVA